MSSSLRLAVIVFAVALVSSGAVMAGEVSESATTDQHASIVENDDPAAPGEWDDADDELGAVCQIGDVVSMESQESCDQFWCERCRACVPSAQVCRFMVCPEL